MNQSKHATASLELPTIDLSPVISGEAGALEAAGKSVQSACQEWGFFCICNHGVPLATMNGILDECARFHAQDMDEKLKIKVGADLLGYLPPGRQVQRSYQYGTDTQRELSASFYMRDEQFLDDSKPGNQRLWSNRWPGNLPGFRNAMIDYCAALDKLLRVLLRLFAVSIDLPPDFCTRHPAFSPPSSTLRLLEYPSQIRDELGLFGIGPHADYGCITILNAGKTPGLEILSRNDRWLIANVQPGCFVINTGQLLSRWSNDRIPATVHRVINTSGGLRHSAAFLVAPRADVKLECLPGCHSLENPPKYPPISFAGYFAEMRRKNFDLS